ncbi:hypothetical protein [Methylomonas methanica]|uniref:Lipoprotein n=1 Tax=Methylomonas methanica (strain DSM 25384 / MC09) TaxID=857087 RepID=G0A7N9_METMM|nr:hypothetical protein [Methylomonas methanica]AEG01882.1 hypothetical protein Metme_3516 [Methylomonas methanica MC09]
MILTRIRRVIILGILLLPACATVQENDTDWPAQLPPHGYFLRSYQGDAINAGLQPLAQYLLWVKRFYRGWELYPSGWENVTRDLLLRVKQPELADEIEEKMGRLGLVISAEWAKNNRTRLINSRHVSIWGNALLKSLEQGETLQILERVAADVDDLLHHRISADVITASRFYAEDDIFIDIN